MMMGFPELVVLCYVMIVLTNGVVFGKSRKHSMWDQIIWVHQKKLCMLKQLWYVCMYVCVCVSMCVCKDVLGMYVSVHVHTYVPMYVYM